MNQKNYTTTINNKKVKVKGDSHYTYKISQKHSEDFIINLLKAIQNRNTFIINQNLNSLKTIIGFHGVRKDFKELIKYIKIKLKKISINNFSEKNKIDRSVLNYKLYPVGQFTQKCGIFYIKDIDATIKMPVK